MIPAGPGPATRLPNGSERSSRPPDGTKGRPLAGGTPGQADLRGGGETGEVPPGEEPNLEYARKATDLVLDYLRDQQRQPDPDLLKKLGWTPDDLQQFLRRWEDLRRTAREDPASRRELEESLKSLGIRPAQEKTRAAAARNDATRGMRETGASQHPAAQLH